MTGVILLTILVLVIKAVIKTVSKTILIAILPVRSIKATLYRKERLIAMRVALKRRQQTLPLIVNGSPTGKANHKAKGLQLRASHDGYKIIIGLIVKHRAIFGHY